MAIYTGITRRTEILVKKITVQYTTYEYLAYWLIQDLMRFSRSINVFVSNARRKPIPTFFIRLNEYKYVIPNLWPELGLSDNEQNELAVNAQKKQLEMLLTYKDKLEDLIRRVPEVRIVVPLEHRHGSEVNTLSSWHFRERGCKAYQQERLQHLGRISDENGLERKDDEEVIQFWLTKLVQLRTWLSTAVNYMETHFRIEALKDLAQPEWDAKDREDAFAYFQDQYVAYANAVRNCMGTQKLREAYMAAHVNTVADVSTVRQVLKDFANWRHPLDDCMLNFKMGYFGDSDHDGMLQTIVAYEEQQEQRRLQQSSK